jgi:hypothetical protein
MKYFSTLPKIFTSDNNGNSIILTNLLARASVINETFDNTLLYYNYDIQEGDTPEIIAHKYYGDMYRYWIVLISNSIMDPQWDWPMTGVIFQDYVHGKYGTTIGDIHHYEKTLTQYDETTLTTTTHTVVISETDYDNLAIGTEFYTLPTGIMSVTTTKRSVDNYNYEFELNESKRNIRLLNRDYVTDFENQFKSLMK